MFLFFGISPKTTRHGFVMHDCRVHGGTAWSELLTRRSYFTLFFLVKIFPVGARHDLLTCTTCGATWQLPRAEAVRLHAQAQTDVGLPKRGSVMGGLFIDAMRSWSQPGPPSAAPSGPQRVQAERLDIPKQKVQWRPNR